METSTPPGGYVWRLVPEPLGSDWRLIPPEIQGQPCAHDGCQRLAVAYQVTRRWAFNRDYRHIHLCCTEHLATHQRTVYEGVLHRAELVAASHVVVTLEQQVRRGRK